jgi:hypothetical protein
VQAGFYLLWIDFDQLRISATGESCCEPDRTVVVVNHVGQLLGDLLVWYVGLLRLVHGEDDTVRYILVSRLDNHQSQPLLVGRGNSVAFSQLAPESQVPVSAWRRCKV